MPPSYRTSSLSDHTSDLLMSQCGTRCNPKADAELAALLWSPLGMLTMLLSAGAIVVSILTHR